MSWDDGKWTAAIPIGEAIKKEYWKTLDKKPGVYRLIAIDEYGKPARLPRVCGTDESGTLYIGASSHPLLNRLGSLVMTHSAAYRSKPHRKLSTKLSQCFPESRLAMTWEYSEEPLDREAELLKAYEAQFGELPPNNSQRSR